MVDYLEKRPKPAKTKPAKIQDIPVYKGGPRKERLVPIYTIGYGGRKSEDFLFLLKKHGINLLVDVRRFPKSKHPEYVKENLEQALHEREIGYVFMGDALGGFRRRYEAYMKTEAYMRGIRDLLDLAKRERVAIMCLERSPKGCHRRHISHTLQDLGVQILHIIRDNVTQEEILQLKGATKIK